MNDGLSIPYLEHWLLLVVYVLMLFGKDSMMVGLLQFSYHHNITYFQGVYIHSGSKLAIDVNDVLLSDEGFNSWKYFCIYLWNMLSVASLHFRRKKIG